MKFTKKQKSAAPPAPAPVDDDVPELLDDIDESKMDEIIPRIPLNDNQMDVDEDEDGFQQIPKKRHSRADKPQLVDLAMETDDQTSKKRTNDSDVRMIAVPAWRRGVLKRRWVEIMTPIVKQLNMQIRYNLRTRSVEIRRPHNDTGNKNNLQKAADFVRAFILGFNIDDAIALIRLDHLFLESFEINDVKTLRGDNLSRAIGRIAGKDGRTKLTIENVTKTRIVLSDNKIHVLGAYQNLRMARHTICSLIMGTPPNKVYGNLRNLSSRLAERL